MPEPNPDLPLQVSPAAIAEIRRFCRQRGYATAQIRITITPGGCQGYRLNLQFAPEDLQSITGVYPSQGEESALPVDLDPVTATALRGATLDYAEDLMGGSFRLQNPQVQGLCACGLSFGGLPPETSVDGAWDGTIDPAPAGDSALNAEVSP